jgi:Reverse transcriptase (RNA-dependent DNA polymerase)
VHIDYCKAFDCVTREKLLFKLYAYGIPSNLLKWIDSFLSNRTQRTRVGSSLSDSFNLTSGVVQGSVIGPLLFYYSLMKFQSFFAVIVALVNCMLTTLSFIQPWF